jgi:hypothetical protein
MRGDFLFSLIIKAIRLLWLALVLLLCLVISVITLPFLLVFEGGRALNRSIDRLFKGIA